MSGPHITGRRRKWIVMAIITAALAVILSPFASTHPDGLERVAEDHDFIEKADTGFSRSPFADYVVNVPLSDGMKTAIAGAIGLALMLALLRILGKLLTNKRDRRV